MINYKLINTLKNMNLIIFVGIGDWGLGIGDWGLGIGPQPPNPQPPTPTPLKI